MKISDLKLDDVGKLILAGTSVALIIRVVGAGSKFLAEIFYARWLGPEQYGVYTYGIGWMQLLAVGAGLGLTNAVLRFIPQYVVEENASLLKGLIRRSQQAVVAAGALLFLVMMLLLWMEASILEEYGTALMVGIACTPLLALMEVQSRILRAKKEIALALVSPSVLWPVGSALLTYALLQMWDVTGGLVALVATGVALTALCVFQFGTIRYVFNDWFQATRAAYHDRMWFVTALPLLLVTGFQIVLDRMDVVMTGSLLGAAEVGVYSAALRTGGLISFMLSASSAITAPMISEYWSSGQREKLERTVEIVVRWTFWSSIVLSLGMALTGKWILGLFGESFVAGYGALLVIIFGKVVHASMGPVTHLLALTGHERLIAKVLGVTAAINVILNYFLILSLGIIGAALATALTMVIWNIWLAVLIKKKMGIDIFAIWGKVIRHR